jgi:opacity protein-like surface antigen
MVIAAVLLGMPVSAVAQGAQAAPDPQGDVFAGYSYLRSGDDVNLHGAIVSLGWNLTGRLAVVVEAARHQGSFDGEDVTSESYLGGGRFWLARGSYRPFVQVTAGVVRTKRGISIFDVDITQTASGFGAAAGAGVDVKVGERWAVRLQGDYRRAKEESESFNDIRASVGAVLRFGSR